MKGNLKMGFWVGGGEDQHRTSEDKTLVQSESPPRQRCPIQKDVGSGTALQTAVSEEEAVKVGFSGLASRGSSGDTGSANHLQCIFRKVDGLLQVLLQTLTVRNLAL